METKKIKELKEAFLKATEPLSRKISELQTVFFRGMAFDGISFTTIYHDGYEAAKKVYEDEIERIKQHYFPTEYKETTLKDLLNTSDYAMAYGMALIASMSFDEYWDWRCDQAKKELHKNIDERARVNEMMEVYELTGFLIKSIDQLYGIPKH